MYPWGDARPYHSYAGLLPPHLRPADTETSGRRRFHLPQPRRHGRTRRLFVLLERGLHARLLRPAPHRPQQVDDAIAFHRRGFPAGTGFLVYFQSYSNTYAPLERLQRLFGEALACPGVAGIVVGTRPDCVDAAKLDYLADLARRTYVCVEYGIESTSDATLRTIDRGHDFAAARRAVEATAARGVAVGAHFILGLPDESDTELLDRTRIINALPLATVKFHQLQFVEGTRMTDLYDAEPARFRRWTAAEYVDLTAEILRRLRPDIAVERIAGQTPPRIRCRRPWGNLRGDALWRMLEKRLVEKNAHQGEFFVSSQR